MATPTTSQADAVPARLPLGGLAAVIAAVGAFAFTLGLTYPLLALILAARGVDAALIGLNAAMTPVGIILASPLIPLWTARLGLYRLAVWSLLAVIASIAALGLVQDLALWFALRLVLGMALAGLFVASETWINLLAPDALRGRLLAAYATVGSAGFALGPGILAWIGAAGFLPFAAGIGVALLAFALLRAARASVPPARGQGAGSFLRFLPLAPRLLAAVFVAALFDQVALSLLPLYGLRHGLDESMAALALGVLVAGNVLLQLPIGWLADRVPRRTVALGCAAASAALCLALPFVIGGGVLRWPVLLALGAAAFALYMLALAELGERFAGDLLIAGNAAFVLMWGVGGMAGPPLGGAAMELFGPDGLPVFLALVFGLLALAIPGRGGAAASRTR